MRQNNGSGKKRFKIIFAVIVLGLALYYYLANREISPSAGFISFGDTSTLAVDKYKSSVDKLKKLMGYYNADLFKGDDFLSLKSFYDLPLVIGQVSNPNPFQEPLLPEELAQEQIQNINR